MLGRVLQVLSETRRVKLLLWALKALGLCILSFYCGSRFGVIGKSKIVIIVTSEYGIDA